MSPKTDRAPVERRSDLNTTNQTSSRQSLPRPPVSRKQWRNLRELQTGGFLRTWVESREGRKA
jgi:hypothetical protein